MRPASSVYVFDAELVDCPGVGCTIAVRGSQTLEDVHERLRQAFGWDDDHLYSFWLSGVHWDSPESEYTRPAEEEESEARSAAVKVESLDLEPKQPIAYVFDFGDSWHVMLELREIVESERGAEYPKLLELRGEPPPQYA